MKLSSINPIAAALAVSLSTAALVESPIVPTPAKPAAEPSMAEGKCGGMSMQKTEKEGKCGEGKCGAKRKKTTKETEAAKPE